VPQLIVPQNIKSWQTPSAKPWQSWLARVFELVKIVVILTMVGYLVHVFIITLFIVDGASMEPNYFDREYMLVDKISYNFSKPARGDVVIFSYPGEPDKKFIKRIIGLPGEIIEIKNDRLYLENKKYSGLLNESYLPSEMPTPTETESISMIKKVGKDEYFVLGDNRLNSSDSRIWGLLPRENIIGKALITIWPIDAAALVQSPKYKFP
jgi:signal peptidase I